MKKYLNNACAERHVLVCLSRATDDQSSPIVFEFCQSYERIPELGPEIVVARYKNEPVYQFLSRINAVISIMEDAYDYGTTRG